MPITSELFRIITRADPAAVWESLSPNARPADYLYGLPLESSWTEGAAVAVCLPGIPGLAGAVLVADRPRRLTFTLGDRAAEPSLYVTWEVCAHPAGTVVRLYVDEIEGSAGGCIDLEAAWLPVLATLQARLDQQVEVAERAGFAGRPDAAPSAERRPAA